MGPRAGLDGRKISSPPGFFFIVLIFSIPDSPARSQSLYRLSYRPTYTLVLYLFHAPNISVAESFNKTVPVS